VGVLGAAFVLRAAGDAGDTWLSWLSPIGWAQALRPFAGERWAVLVLPLAATGVLLATALALSSRRDVGAGLLATRTGPATASAWLSGPLGLAVRLQRASLLAWCSGLFVLGLAYGSVGESVEDLAADNDAMAELIAASGTDVVDAFFVVAATMLALIVGGLGLQSALRLRAEESAGRAEPLLATATSRQAVLGAHVVVALVGSTLGLACAGVGLGAAHALLTGDATQLPRLAAAVLAHAPAVWVLVGLAAALFGLLPRAAPLVWAALAGSVVIALLGEPLRLPGWVRDLSPFTHVPQLPEQTVSWPPLLALTACSAVLAVLGTWAFTRRDVG
jgi:ABC-2 type transport system permease protein